MLLHNPLNSIQTEPCTLPNSFGCEKRLEDMRLHFVWNSRTVVGNLNHNATVLLVGSDAQLSLSVHCINRVIDKVGPYLVELAPK